MIGKICFTKSWWAKQDLKEPFSDCSEARGGDLTYTIETPRRTNSTEKITPRVNFLFSQKASTKQVHGIIQSLEICTATLFRFQRIKPWTNTGSSGYTSIAWNTEHSSPILCSVLDGIAGIGNLHPWEIHAVAKPTRCFLSCVYFQSCAALLWKDWGIPGNSLQGSAWGIDWG